MFYCFEHWSTVLRRIFKSWIGTAKGKTLFYSAWDGLPRWWAHIRDSEDFETDDLIFSFSCSEVVSRQLFYDTIVSAAIQAGREVKVLHQLSQPADHPISIYHPEGDYLKGLVLYVN